MEKKYLYYVKQDLRHNGTQYKTGNVITEYDLEEFKPEDIDRLLKLGVISASKVALDEHDGFVEYID